MMLSHIGATGSTQAIFNLNMNEPPGTASTDVSAFWEGVIGGSSADGLPSHLMRVYEIGSPHQFALYNVYAGISSGHEGTTASYQVELRHDHGNISGGQFTNNDDVVATFTQLAYATTDSTPNGPGGYLQYNYNWILMGPSGSSAGGLTMAALDEDFIPFQDSPFNVHGVAWRFAAGDGHYERVSGPTGAADDGAIGTFSGVDAMLTSHMRITQKDKNNKDLYPDINQLMLNEDAIKMRVTVYYRTKVDIRDSSPSHLSPAWMGSPSGIWAEYNVHGFGEDDGMSWFGETDGGTAELGITIGEIAETSWSQNGTATLSDMMSQLLGTITPSAVGGGHVANGDGTGSLSVPVKIEFLKEGMGYTRTGASRWDGTRYVNDASLTHLGDVSGSLSSQISSAETNPKGDVSGSLVIQYNPTTSEWEASESGIESRNTISFRIESDVPITTGDNKILRTIPFESRIDAMTLVVPDGVAIGKVQLGLDKYSPGYSFPTTSGVLTDLDVSSNYQPVIESTDGNTYYLGITSGGIEKTVGGWADSGLSAGDILTVNVDVNTANVNTILGDIVLKRLS